MKIKFLLLIIFYFIFKGTHCQTTNFDILMPSINPLFADSAFPLLVLPVNQHVPTFGNGTKSTTSQNLNVGTTTITDEADVVIFSSSDPQTEPHLIINKNHPNNIIISCNYHYAIVLSPNSPYGTYKKDQSIFTNDNFNTSFWQNFQFYPPGGLRVNGDPSTA